MSVKTSTYVAIINVPGYLPNEALTDYDGFTTAREAWQYLVEELDRDNGGWVPVDSDDPEGPQNRSETALELERMVDKNITGSIYGPSPGYEGDHDLGLAYSVDRVF